MANILTTLCPICDHPFIQQNTMGKSFKSIRISNTNKRKKIKPPPVVAAQCGDLYHRVCLHQYCSVYNYGKASQTDPVNCPVCGKTISLSRVRVIDFTAHKQINDSYHKVIHQLEMMTDELVEQYHNNLGRNETAEKALNELVPVVNGLQNRVETFEIAIPKHVLLADTKQAISETKSALKVVREYNNILVKTLLSILKEYSPTMILEKEILPTELIPALELLNSDKTVLEKLADIVAPKPYLSSADTVALIADLLTFVRKNSLYERLDMFYEELKNEATLRKPPSQTDTPWSKVSEEEED